MIKWFTSIFGLPIACAVIGAVMAAGTVLLPLAGLIFGAEEQGVIIVALFITKILGVPWSFLLPIQAANGDVAMLFVKSSLGVLINGAILGLLAGVFFTCLTPYDAVGSDLDDHDKNPYQYDS